MRAPAPNATFTGYLLPSPKLLVLEVDRNNLFFTRCGGGGGGLSSSVLQLQKEPGAPEQAQPLQLALLKGCTWCGAEGTRGQTDLDPHSATSQQCDFGNSHLNMEPQFPHLSYDYLEGPMEKPSALLYSGNGALAREVNTYSTNRQLSRVTRADLTKVTPQGAAENGVLAPQIPCCLASVGENGCWLPSP